jgi:hypothetical protein
MSGSIDGCMVACTQVTAAKASEVVAKHIDAAVAKVEERTAASKPPAAAAAAAATAATAATAAAAAAAAPAGSSQAEAAATVAAAAGLKTRGIAEESFDDAGEAAEVAAAAAAGDIVDVVLFAPGRLLYVKPVDEGVEDAEQHFELLDGKGGECRLCSGGRGGGR